MTNCNLFRGADGLINWKAYKQAQADAGEICKQCGTYLFNSLGHSQLCGHCRALESFEEVTHSQFIRCPNCGDCWNPSDADDHEVYEDGEHDVCCGNCNHDFVVSTQVSFTFTSPARINYGEDDL